MSQNPTVGGSGIPEPESYYLPPTKHVPNSPCAYLVYRDVLPKPVTAESAEAFVTSHGWTRKGPIWKAWPKRHFHPNVHECYAILSGESEVLMGVGANDLPETIESSKDIPPGAPGLCITLREGDVCVHPAGTAHSNLMHDDDYQYLAFFPDDAPHWVSKKGDEPLDLAETRAQTMAVPMPQDPVIGGTGYLHRIWEQGRELFKAGERP